MTNGVKRNILLALSDERQKRINFVKALLSLADISGYQCNLLKASVTRTSGMREIHCIINVSSFFLLILLSTIQIDFFWAKMKNSHNTLISHSKSYQLRLLINI